MYDVGDRARLTFSLTDVNGAPANGTVVLTVTKPDASSSSPAVTNAGTGSYTADVDLDQAGRWSYRWVSTGAVVAAQTGVLDIAAAAPVGVVSLADVKARLGITSTTNDEELRHYIDVATDFIESHVGPVAQRTIVSPPVFPSNGVVEVPPPVISLTSVTTALGYPTRVFDVATMYLDGEAGIIRVGPYQPALVYPVTVTYVAGRTIVPALLQDAALDYIAWRWESQRGASNAPFQGGADEFAVQPTATVPYKILQALAPYSVPAMM